MATPGFDQNFDPSSRRDPLVGIGSDGLSPRDNGVVAKRSNAAGCKPAGLAPSEVRILPAPPMRAFAWEVLDASEGCGPHSRVMSGSSSVGRASAFQAEGRGSESRLPLQTPERPRGSVVEHFLGKEGVTGSIPVVGSGMIGFRIKTLCKTSFNCNVVIAKDAITVQPKIKRILRTNWNEKNTVPGAVIIRSIRK